jgi:hypothetical protein
MFYVTVYNPALHTPRNFLGPLVLSRSRGLDPSIMGVPSTPHDGLYLGRLFVKTHALSTSRFASPQPVTPDARQAPSRHGFPTGALHFADLEIPIRAFPSVPATAFNVGTLLTDSETVNTLMTSRLAHRVYITSEMIS